MKFEDLHDVDVGDILKCKDLDVTFEVVEIDMATKLTPIRVKMPSGYSTTVLVAGILSSDRFDESYKQWLYANPENLRIYVPSLEDAVDMSKLITLDRLVPLQSVESVETTEFVEPVKLEILTASKATEITKRRLINEVLNRIEHVVNNTIGVFEIKISDLDLDPVTSDLEELGYVVRFSMQDDAFSIPWEPKLWTSSLFQF